MAKSPDTATRARRLLALLPLLKRGETIPIAELAAAVGCSPAEAAADLAALTMCGVPPFTPVDMIELDIQGDHVTVYIDPPGLDRPLRLTVAEARALGAALDAAGYEPDSALRRTLASVSGGDASAAELERTVRAGAAPGGLASLYATLAMAADEHDKARITYLTGSSGRLSERVVHPWALVNRSGTWYLVAFCEGVGEERVFRLDRIRSAERLGVTFPPPAAVPLAVIPRPDELPVAEVVFAPGASLSEARTWPGATLETRPDGSTLVRVGYQTVPWIARRVAARLGEAEVIEPAEVREAVRALADAVLAERR